MGGEKLLHVGGIDVDHVILAHDPGGGTTVAVGNTETAALVIDEAVKGDPPFGTQVKQQLRCQLQLPHLPGTAFKMDALGYTVGCPVVDTILPAAPVQSGPVQVSDVPEHTTRQDILLDEPYQPLHLALGEVMPGLAEPGAEVDGLHKCLIILLPHGMSLKIPVENDTFHVVGQNVLGDAHVGEAVDHADEEVLLLCIGEELHIPLPTMMTDHGEAGSSILAAVVVHHIGEAPVHLEGFSRLRGEPAATAALGCHQLPFGGN